jgi:hypothetical protein
MRETTVNEWNSLKRQFDVLVHNEGVGAESIDEAAVTRPPAGAISATKGGGEPVSNWR